MDAEDCLAVTLDEALREALVAPRMTLDELRLELAVALYQGGVALLWQGAGARRGLGVDFPGDPGAAGYSGALRPPGV
jgi:hypothetical protein